MKFITLSKPDLVLEYDDLLYRDVSSGTIVVDKSIFDDFVPETCINIKFVESDEMLQFKMISEDEDGITMTCL